MISTLTTLVDYLFAVKFDQDDREILTSWQIPISISPSFIHIVRGLVDWNDATANSDELHAAAELSTYNVEIGIIGFDIRFWGIAFTLLMFQSMINILASLVIYYGIIKQGEASTPERLEDQTVLSATRKRIISPSSSYLLAYGIVCPLLLYLPFPVISLCGLRNLSFVLCITGATPAILFFRCLEAVHGTYPSYVVNGGLRQFLLYYVSSIPFRFDQHSGSPVPVSRGKLYHKLLRFLSVFLQSALLYSILIPFGYQLFPRLPVSKVENLLYWGNIANSYLMASLTSLVLESGSAGLGLFTSGVFGIETMDIHHAPLTKSTSPSDFWGKRWDVYIADSLRRGVYLPLRIDGQFSPAVSILGTFITSGLLHEYMLVVMRQVSGTQPVQMGYQFLFFIWCAVIILWEHTMMNHAPLKRILLQVLVHVPGPVVTLSVLMTVLPLAFLFTDEYIACGFYSDIAMGFPRIIVRTKAQYII